MSTGKGNQENSTMDGIRFVVAEDGSKEGVLIDLKKHGDLWEDVYDALTARARAKEPRESLKEVKSRLRRRGKLNE
jgi:hypothetical protein